MKVARTQTLLSKWVKNELRFRRPKPAQLISSQWLEETLVYKTISVIQLPFTSDPKTNLLHYKYSSFVLSLSTPKHHNTCFTQKLLSNLQIALYSKSLSSFEFESNSITSEGLSTSNISNIRCPNTHPSSGSAESQSSNSLQSLFAVNTP